MGTLKFWGWGLGTSNHCCVVGNHKMQAYIGYKPSGLLCGGQPCLIGCDLHTQSWCLLLSSEELPIPAMWKKPRTGSLLWGEVFLKKQVDTRKLPVSPMGFAGLSQAKELDVMANPSQDRTMFPESQSCFSPGGTPGYKIIPAGKEHGC